MATALDLIRRSMRLMGALAEGEVPTAEQAQDGLVSLQAMLGDWETRGVRLGGLVDATLSTFTVVPVPVTHLNAIAFNLAVVMAPEYGRGEALQSIIPQAERAFDALQAQYASVPQVAIDPALVSQTPLTNIGAYIWESGAEDGALASDSGALYP